MENKKILNPLNRYTKGYLNSLPIIEHNNKKFRELISSYTDIPFLYTGCQCFHDCDCSNHPSPAIVIITTYYRNADFDNTDKAFHSEIDYLPVGLKPKS